ncbi:MAG: hypothetical protein UV82_C0011G0069 [Candidatus Magasanikbacteria bacterium GW2011_GWD2_43_18]|nr:MAG: hypothetical protein UV18_C0015G0005 [Candidatus Magasanikbacteria bacterium GW2011_GWC2_42_27]KKT04141.1 MAG: hypothetical protein UV82_C0011G0069 [Candidatus Magasanikbacteria bacterium GW2011_GWD2_43_18]KKT25681.1 MAG: hypothetical protein UW10_C0005G0048 [Candidatus Magasanikbacteria bacterium GW2011_GWA2_43_9]HBB38503.1 hypothetical protein [Candidatus Magasanikbacteria bacterium]HCC13951.1 hypothetical protein [Candidatus Magasanikbacteria bacterium]
MGTITRCDLCNKKRGSKDDWSSITLNTSNKDLAEKIGSYGYQVWDLCPACSAKVIPATLKVLKKKK